MRSGVFLCGCKGSDRAGRARVAIHDKLYGVGMRVHVRDGSSGEWVCSLCGTARTGTIAEPSGRPARRPARRA